MDPPNCWFVLHTSRFQKIKIFFQDDTDDATTTLTTEDSLVKEEFNEENDDELSMVDDLVNFPTTTTRESDDEMITATVGLRDLADDAVNFPPNTTTHDNSNIKFFKICSRTVWSIEFFTATAIDSNFQTYQKSSLATIV